MPLVIRHARPEDVRTIAEFAMKLVAQHHDYDPARFARIADIEGMTGFYGGRVNAGDAALLVADMDGRLAGFAYVQFDERNYAALLEKAAWLHDLYVAEYARKSGAGKGLIREAATAAKQLGAEKLMLSVAAENTFAKDIFERNGFEATMIEMMLNLAD